MPTLKADGDLYEKRFGDYLLPAFPNYEAFWAEFIVPMRGSDGIHLRPDIDPLLLGLAEAHYTVFWHLMTVHRLLERQAKSADETILLFDAVFFHLSAATEMGERVLFNLALIESRVTGDHPAGFELLSDQEITGLVKQYVASKKYQKQLGRLRTRAQTVSLPLHSREDVYKPFFERANASDAHAKFIAIAGGVREYRNRIAHNPELFKVTKDGRPSVPTRQHLSTCASWAQAVESATADGFQPIDELESQFLKAVESTLNLLWEAILPYSRQLSNTPAYDSMLRARLTDQDRFAAGTEPKTIQKMSSDFLKMTALSSASAAAGNDNSLEIVAPDWDP